MAGGTKEPKKKKTAARNQADATSNPSAQSQSDVSEQPTTEEFYIPQVTPFQESGHTDPTGHQPVGASSFPCSGNHTSSSAVNATASKESTPGTPGETTHDTANNTPLSPIDVLTSTMEPALEDASTVPEDAAPAAQAPTSQLTTTTFASKESGLNFGEGLPALNFSFSFTPGGPSFQIQEATAAEASRLSHQQHIAQGSNAAQRIDESLALTTTSLASRRGAITPRNLSTAFGHLGTFSPLDFDFSQPRRIWIVSPNTPNFGVASSNQPTPIQGEVAGLENILTPTIENVADPARSQRSEPVTASPGRRSPLSFLNAGGPSSSSDEPCPRYIPPRPDINFTQDMRQFAETLGRSLAQSVYFRELQSEGPLPIRAFARGPGQVITLDDPLREVAVMTVPKPTDLSYLKKLAKLQFPHALAEVNNEHIGLEVMWLTSHNARAHSTGHWPGYGVKLDEGNVNVTLSFMVERHKYCEDLLRCYIIPSLALETSSEPTTPEKNHKKPTVETDDEEEELSPESRPSNRGGGKKGMGATNDDTCRGKDTSETTGRGKAQENEPRSNTQAPGDELTNESKTPHEQGKGKENKPDPMQVKQQLDEVAGPFNQPTKEKTEPLKLSPRMIDRLTGDKSPESTPVKKGKRNAAGKESEEKVTRTGKEAGIPDVTDGSECKEIAET